MTLEALIRNICFSGSEFGISLEQLLMDHKEGDDEDVRFLDGEMGEGASVEKRAKTVGWGETSGDFYFPALCQAPDAGRIE